MKENYTKNYEDTLYIPLENNLLNKYILVYLRDVSFNVIQK